METRKLTLSATADKCSIKNLSNVQLLSMWIMYS